MLETQMDELKTASQDMKDTERILKNRIMSEVEKIHRKIDGSHMENQANEHDKDETFSTHIDKT